MDESILSTIRKLVNVGDDECYDGDLLVHINSQLSILNQLGAGPPGGLHIENADATWRDFVGDAPLFDAVKTYVYLQVKLIFDPPTQQAVLQSMKETIAELAWRISAHYDV